MAELLAIQVWQFKINFPALTAVSNHDGMFIGVTLHFIEQKWPCVFSVNYVNNGIKSKIKYKVNLSSKINLDLIS